MLKFKLILIALLSLILSIGLFSQEKKHEKRKERMQDVFDELDFEKLALRFFNALDGKPIPDATVVIEQIGTFQSDVKGRISFPIPENDGFYNVNFSKKGFINSNFKIEIQAGSLFFNRFSVSPSIPIGTLRVVLDWGETPKDLDAHFVKKDDYHISYRNMKVSADGVAMLDRDDVTSYGPETITANRIDESAIYYYYIHDYTNRNNPSNTSLSNSKACVKVFGGNNQLLEVFQVPLNQSGNHWPVFKIENGSLNSLNRETKSDFRY
ncbi:MAG: hypothetical protein MUC94_12380 [bacterium]|nr:hypothetical protein [bacterium]